VPFTWRYQRALAGSGALADIGSHLIDLSRFLVGEIDQVEGATLETFIRQRPVPVGHVIGHARAQSSGEVREVDTDDVAAFTVRFRHGAVGDFRCNRVAAGFRNSPAFELIGSHGSAAFDMERPAEFQFFDASRDDDVNGFRRVVTGPSHPYFESLTTLPVAGAGYGYAETYVAQAYEFVRAVVSGSADSIPNFEDGYAVALVCDAVLRAAEQGRRVQIDEIGGPEPIPLSPP
jgi:predicted dehydrogenase